MEMLTLYQAQDKGEYEEKFAISKNQNTWLTFL